LLNAETEADPNALETVPKEHINWEINQPPTRKEVEMAFKDLANHKSPGEDLIISEIFRYVQPPTFLDMITNIFHNCWTNDIPSLPEKMMLINISPIHKKGCKATCSNYRGISVTSHVLKALSRVIYNRIDAHCESRKIMRESQHAFRKERNTGDMILAARLLQSSFKEKNIPLFFAFVDIQKAYDSVC
jgi:Reverse transcriptase (RNA-dependent DNA polymerase)